MILSLAPALLAFAQAEPVPEGYRLENPITVEYLQTHLEDQAPRLVLNSEIEEHLREKLRTDPVVQNMYQALRLNADDIRSEPLLERELTGRRLLSVSREMLYRMNVLGMVYRIDGEPDVLDRINEELLAVIGFSDWNPSHYLDVAEMSMAVAIAVDWAGDDLPAGTVRRAKAALVEKGITPSYDEQGNVGWITNDNNWNQVCHAGMIAAATVVADEEPELAATTINRALDGMPYALKEYGPDGVYPEGPTYWGYGTTFSVLTASIFESAFGTDFGLARSPGFLESPEFLLLSMAPSGSYFNFSDSGDSRNENGDLTLAWFAAKTGNARYFEAERFLRDPGEMEKLGRQAGAGLVWLSQFEREHEGTLPLAWKGDGANPVVFFRGGDEDPRRYYFAAKGGRGSVSHGNMDAGTFVFELDGVRWVVDPGNQNYHELEQVGFDLWGRCQECERWTLLTKSNFGHSTLTVDDSLNDVDGFAPIVRFSDGDRPEAVIDLSEVFEGELESAERTFRKESATSLLIEDELELSESADLVTWQLMTTADVVFTPDGAVLEQEGKRLKLTVLAPEDVRASVISLDPPPLQLDRRIDHLKRIEIRVPAYLFPDGRGSIQVRLSADRP